MFRRQRRQGVLAWGAAIAATVIVGLPAPVSAACDEWFPDLNCEERAGGRPDGFVMPIISPYQFEDPFITTGVNLVGIWHDWPGDSVFGGGDAWIIALQARIAITDRLAFIATKDGIVFNQPENKGLLRDEQGFFDIGAGFKYLAYQSETLWIAPSLRMDIPVGEDDVFSGNGDGVLIPDLSFAAKPFGELQVIGDLGFRIALDSDEESTSLFYHLHLAYPLHEYFVPLVELSATHWLDGGDGTLEVDTKLATLPLSVAQAALGTGEFEGADVVNLGSKGIAGASLVTMAFGFRIPLSSSTSLGGAYEIPVTSREDIFNQRVSMMLTVEL